MTTLTQPPAPAYARFAVTLLAAELGSSNDTKAHKRHRNAVGAFLCPQYIAMVAVRETPSGVPGSFVSGLPTCVQSPPQPAWQQAVVTPITKESHQ